MPDRSRTPPRRLKPADYDRSTREAVKFANVFAENKATEPDGTIRRIQFIAAWAGASEGYKAGYRAALRRKP